MQREPGTRDDEHAEPTPASSTASSEKLETTLARGRSPSTPFLLLGSVALTVWSVAALVTMAALLVWWLV